MSILSTVIEMRRTCCETMILYWFNKKTDWRQDDQNRRILGREKAQSSVVTQTQRTQDENASLIKVPSHVANTDKNYGLM